MANIFLSTNKATDFQQDYHEYLKQNAAIINQEEDECFSSQPMSLNSSPVATDVQTENCVHNPYKFSERSSYDLCSIYEIPRKYQHVFALYPSFNAIQSKVLDDVLYSDASIVVSAPTGSGKTVIFELAIIRLLVKLEDMEFTGEYKIVYMAPVKALCSERFEDWRSKFSSVGLRCKEYTGDTDEYDLSSLSAYHLILTTPEKWDSLTRKWKDNKGIVHMVKLFLIDEVHLLNEEQRGPTLEAVVSRMKTVQGAIGVTQRQKQEHHQSDSQTMLSEIRFLAVSATIPNTEDIACWLGESIDSPARFFKIADDMRPVKLQKIVLGYSHPGGTSQFHFEMSLSYKLHALLFKYADGKPTLIFCSTRKGVEHTCSILLQQITFHFNTEQKQRICEVAIAISENKLKECVMAGVGYHHAGMAKDDRQAVERLFREGMLPVLVTTSTLAMGVNLPAHLVIIKATQQYIGGAYKDYTETQILQMIGRAGRPQFDTSAVAIIMTKESQRSRYEKVMSGKDLIESNLHQHLAEHLNSEVVLRTITDIGYAMEWIRSTYLYVRALQNPSHYGIPCNLNKKGIEGKLQEMCQRELNALASAKLLTIDHRMDVHPTKDGALMARFYLNLGTMKAFHKVNGHESLEEILAIVASCHEFSGMKLRASEKKTLNLLNKARDHECIRFPLPTRIMTTEMKINCLIQAFLGCLPIHEPSLKQDVLRIMWVGKRVTSALVQYLLQHPHYQALVSAITLAKCFHCKLWENSPHMSRQLKGIGTALSSLLVASNKTSFQSIIEANPRDLESILNRPPPTGDKLIAEVNHLPNFELRTESETSLSVTQVDISVEMTNRAVIQEHNAARENHWLFLLVGDSNNKCIYKERFKDTCLLKDMKRCKVEIKDPPSVNEVYVKLISEQWVGLDVHSSIKLQQPREAMTLKAKNSIEKYLKKQGLNYTSLSSKWSNPQTMKRAKSSVVDQIKDMSEKRLGNTLSMTPTKLTLDKYAYIPAKKPKLHPLLDQPKSMEDEGIDALSQFSIPENCSTEQVNPEMNFRQIKSKLTTDEQVYSPHKSSKAGNSEQDIMPTQADDKIRTLLKFQSTNLLEGPEMQLNQCRVTKCNKDPDEQNTVVLQHTGTGHSDGTQHSPTLNDGKRGPTYEVPTPQQPNESAQKEASHYETDLKITEPSTSKMNENYHQPFEQNVKLHKDSILQDKHLKKDEINEGFIPRIKTLKSQLEYPETKTSAIVNSQLPYNLHDSLMEGCSSEESKTNKFSFQTRKSSVHEDTTPASTLLLDADYNLCKKYLKTQILRRNMPACDNNLSLQEKLTVSSNDTQSENTGSDGKHNGKNDSAIVCDNRTAHTSCSPMNRQQTVTSINQNSLSLHTKERIPVRKKLVFEKTLPKHYYPIFMKSLEYDTNETTQRYSSMCDQLKEASSEPTPPPLMIEAVTINETLSDPGEKVMCSFNTETAPSENVITRVKKLHPCPKKEANFYTPVQIKNKRSALSQQSSEVQTQDSLTSENGLQVQEENNIKNKKVDTESQPRNDQVLPEFDLVKDLESLLSDMSGEENGKFKCANKSKKCNDSFMANIPILSKHSAQNKSVGHTIPHNSSRRNDSKYEPILSLLLKDVSRREAMPYSSRVKAYEESETNVHSQLLSPEFKFEPKSQDARSKVTLSQLTQKLSGHHSTVMLNKNSDNTFPLSKSAQSKNCNGKHIQDQLKYPPSDQNGFTKIMCGSDTVPGDMNKIFNENETYKRRNDVRAVINIPVQQPSLSTQRKSYSNTCEFEDLSCTQPWTLPVEETASKFHPTKCVPGNVQNSSILNSKWQKFEMSPIHSADSPDYY